MKSVSGAALLLSVVLSCLGRASPVVAEELAIQAFNNSGMLVFNTLHGATNYRLEWASSPAGPWKDFTSAAGAWDFIPAVDAGSVTCAVPVFYRVVASVTNAWLSLETVGDLAFGGVAVGDETTRTLTLRNRGGAALTVTGIDYPEGFSGNWSGTIPAGYEQDVTVTFAPRANMEYGGVLTVHTDATYGLFTLAVSGSGSSEYLVIDVSDGPSATNYPVSYLVAGPGVRWSDIYRTSKIVLRRMPATTNAFVMGSPSGELGRGADETQHAVELTQDFYVCVFEVTQRQWERVTGTWPSYFNNAAYRDTRPVEMVPYNAVRGATLGAGWPASSSVDATSFLGKLRARTGLAFDLPTESQWEYACRAGTTTALNSGDNLASTGYDGNMSEIGRYYYNGAIAYTSGSDTSQGSAKVGSYLPNAWGLYDMHGNVWEWCLDWYGTYPGMVSDPVGKLTGTDRVARGGSWLLYASRCRAAVRGWTRTDYVDNSIGFRFALTPGRP